MKHKVFQLLALSGLLLGASQCSHIPIDSAVSAADGNDHSVVQIRGLGAESRKGYLFAQVADKAASTGNVALVAPVVDCDRPSCVRFQWFRKDGSFGYAGAMPKGVSQASMFLSDIIGHTGQIDPHDDGEYSVVMQVYFKDASGHETSMVGNGFVRLNVLNEAYRPVGCNDPSIAWKVKTSDNCEAQFTTAFRTVNCGACE